MVSQSSSETLPVLSFQFSGDLADDGKLDFYEASRFLYGASRLVYTIEHFRKTGAVASRIGSRIDAGFNIGAPQAGSWVADVMGAAAPIIGAAGGGAVFLEVPLKALVGWVFKKLTGGRANQIETFLKIERERTKQSQQETLRARLHAASSDRFADMLEKQLDRKDDFMKFLIDEVREAKVEAQATRRLDKELALYEKELAKVKEKDVKRLLAKTRPQVTELGLPLKGSASRLLVGGKSTSDKVIYLNRRTVDVLEGNSEDVATTDVTADVVRFDKESGWGKFRVVGQPGQMSFFVPREQRLELKGEVIDAMKQDNVVMSVRYVRDQQKNIKYAKVEMIGLLE